LNVEAAAPTLVSGREFDVDCLLAYEVHGTTDFLFQIHALNGRDQVVLSESLTLLPPIPVHVYNDPTELHRCTRLQVNSGRFELHYQARVRRTLEAEDPSAGEVPIWQLPDGVLQYLLPTRYCESDLLSHTAQKLFGGMQPGRARVNAICDWIHSHIDYQPGTSTATTTARDVFTQRTGVCRDFAHLGVTFCRALNIPARLVAGYSNFDTPPPDFHAVFEAYLSGQWVIFDATSMSDLAGLVRITSGRDAKDVAFAMIYGPATMLSMNPTATPVR
jgi:transglutaminase-like putative cysteine protease